MARTRFELKSIVSHHLLPGVDSVADRGNGVPMTFYWTKDTHELWLAGADGKMACVTELLLGGEGSKNKVSMIKGDRGERGDQGLQGIPGDVLIPNESALAAAVIQLRADKARFQAVIAEQISLNEKRKSDALKSAVRFVLQTIKAQTR
jgi:hypothetical protein